MALAVDPVFADPGKFGSGAVWLAVLGYAVQIYCDFSGYTDMALGLAHTARVQAAEQLQRPVPGDVAGRVLAALAHQPVAVAARLPVHPARRQPPRAGADDDQPVHHHDARRAVARGQLDVRRLGRVPRHAPGRAAADPNVWDRPALRPLGMLMTFLRGVRRLGVLPWRRSFADAGTILRGTGRPDERIRPARATGRCWCMVCLAATLIGQALGQMKGAGRLMFRLPVLVAGAVMAAILTLALLLTPGEGKVFIYFQF